MFRTGEKLQQASLSSSSASASEDSGCLLCGGMTDTATEEPCALQATKFSRIVSEKGAIRLTEEFLRSVKNVKLSTEDEYETPAAEDGNSPKLQNIEEDKVRCTDDICCLLYIFTDFFSKILCVLRAIRGRSLGA